VDAVEVELRTAYQRVFDGYWACLRAPSSCDMSWLAEGSRAAVTMQGTLQALIDRDRFVGRDDVGTFVVEHVSVDAAGDRAEVTACWTMYAVLYGAPADPTAPAGPSNPPTIVNNTPGSARQRDVVVRDGDTWDVAESVALDVRAEVDLCSGG
jgi:hypothetical protein